jgi:hypothetical protein
MSHFNKTATNKFDNRSSSTKSLLSDKVIIRKSTMILHNKNDIRKVYVIEKEVSVVVLSLTNSVETWKWIIWCGTSRQAQDHWIGKSH